MAKITFDDKIKVKDIAIAEVNKFTEANANEIKTVVNGLDDSILLIEASLPTEYATVVYIDTNNPNTATIFDDVNPPVTNDSLLEDDVDNLYIGLDSSTWVYNGSIYTTKVVPETSNFTINGTPVDAGNNKTSPISRLGAVTVQEKLNDTSDNSGSSLNPRHFGFWNWLAAVTKYGKIKWDNIGVNVTFQLPTTANNSTEVFAMVSDLDDKQDVLTDANFGTFENSLTAKTTPIDADLITIVDTADSNKAKKTTFTQLKSFFKTYWDTLYQVILVSGTNIKTINGSSILGSGDLVVGGAGATDLGYTASPTDGTVTSSTGTDATIPLADGTNAGLLKPAKYTVLENTSGTNTGDQDLSGLQPKGVRITNATTTGSYAVDWNAGDVWQLTLTGATTITDTNLPTGTATKVIELMVKGAFSITLPAYWEATPASGTYTGAKWNHIVVSCIVGTTSSEKVIYSNEVLAT